MAAGQAAITDLYKVFYDIQFSVALTFAVPIDIIMVLLRYQKRHHHQSGAVVKRDHDTMALCSHEFDSRQLHHLYIFSRSGGTGIRAGLKNQWW